MRSQSSSPPYSFEVLCVAEDGSGWFLTATGNLVLHKHSLNLKRLCRIYNITPEPGTFLIDDEVFFVRSRRDIHEGPVSIRSFNIASMGCLRNIVLDRLCQMYYAGITMKDGRIYHWDGNVIYELVRGCSDLVKICELQIPICELAVVCHDDRRFSFYHNDRSGNLYFNSCEEIGTKLGTSFDCEIRCGIIGSYKDSVVGYQYNHRMAVIINNGEVVRMKKFTQPLVNAVCCGKYAYFLFDGRIEALNVESMTTRLLGDAPKGILVLCGYR